MSIIQKIFSDSTPDEFDIRYGVRTAGRIPRWKLWFSSINAIYGRHYQPVSETELQAALESLDEDFRKFTFIDLGCGKGRALVIAERYDFKSIIGVEYNSKLALTAKQNTTRSKIICSDAADFNPPDDNLIVFLYNPFSEAVMSKVVAKLSNHKRKLFVIYCNPQCADLFDFMKPLGPIAENFLAWTNQPSR